MHHKFRILRAAVPMLCALGAVAADRPGLSLCIDSEQPPFSSAAAPERGIDVEVAQALAAQLDRPLRLVWVQVPNRGGLGKALRQTIGAGQCDAYIGIPDGPDMARELAERRLVASGAYLDLGYMLVSRKAEAPPRPGDLQRARKLGAVTATPADLHLHRIQAARAPYPGNAALLSALRTGEIDMAVVWSAALGGEAGRDLVAADFSAADPSLRTSRTVVTRAADAELARAVSSAVGALRAQGVFDAMAQRHGLPLPGQH